MILRHLRYILTKHTRRIDDDARAHCTPVCMHGKDSSVLHVHTRHAGIQRKVRTVLHGVLRHGNLKRHERMEQLPVAAAGDPFF